MLHASNCRISHANHNRKLYNTNIPAGVSPRLPYPFTQPPSAIKAAIRAGTMKSQDPEAFSSRWDSTVAMWASRDPIQPKTPAIAPCKGDSKVEEISNLDLNAPDSIATTSIISRPSGISKPKPSYDPSKGFESFPGELRNALYRAIFVQPPGQTTAAFTINPTTMLHQHQQPALAEAFPRLRAEILSLFYNENTFNFARTSNPTLAVFEYFLSSIGDDNLQHLRNITIAIGIHYSSDPGGYRNWYSWEHSVISTRLSLDPQTGLVHASLCFPEDQDFCVCQFIQFTTRENAVTSGKAFTDKGGNALVHHVGKLFDLLRRQQRAWETRCPRGTAPVCPQCGGGKSYWCCVADVERIVQSWSPSEVWEAS